MTADERQLIKTCAARGVEFDELDAGFVLLAQKVLARDPKNEDAKKVLEKFAEHLRTGVKPCSFAGFCLRDPDASV